MLVRFDVDRELDDLRREVNRAFSGFPPVLGATDRWLPAMDAVEEDGNIRIVLDVPGMSEADIDVQVEGDRLTICGTREIEREGEGQRWHRHERSTGRFERTLQLPERIDADRVNATFDEGVLVITLPNPVPTLPPRRRIEITHGEA